MKDNTGKRLLLRISSYFVLVNTFVFLLVGCEFILPNKPPYFELTSPEEKRIYTFGEVIPIMLNAYDKDGTVVEVEFYLNETLAYTDETDPFEFPWATADFAPGDYVLKIKALDNDSEHYILSYSFTVIGTLIANAGDDITIRSAELTHSLLANQAPEGATGTWTVIQGEGGTFSDVNANNAVFTGQPCTSYTLRWTVAHGSVSRSDDVNVVYYHTPSDAVAGEDQYFADGRNETTLAATAAGEGLGRWNIVSGGTGKFDDNLDPTTKFTGQTCTEYVLSWTVSTACGSTQDEVKVHFDHITVASNAGPDQDYIDGRNTTTLAANDPGTNQGTWSILSGTGGAFSDVHDPAATFVGQACQVYELQWAIASGCGASEDEVQIGFGHIPTTASAGEAQHYLDGRVFTILEGNEPSQGTGEWTVVSGAGGTFDDAAKYNAKFTGTLCESYVLKWTIATACSALDDEVDISFGHTPSEANAGEDQVITSGNVVTTLAANTPLQGGGKWTILSGQNGNVLDPDNPTSTFTGQLCGAYILQWEISTACGTSADQVVISFDHVQVPAFAGPDQSFFDGSTSTTLTGNDPVSYTGTWTILAGSGGSFSDVNDPDAAFNGSLGQVYTLQWSITSTCGVSTDIMRVAFLTAGAFTDSRDGQVYSTIVVGGQEWMAKNLNYKTVNGSYAYGGEETLRSTYGLLYQHEAASQACPAGFHLPTDAEWRTLENILGMSVEAALLYGYRGYEEGASLKESGLSHWHSPNAGAANLIGFTALPSGYRDQQGFYQLMGSFAGYWTDTEDTNGINAIYRGLSKDKAQIGRDWFNKNMGLSVRCVKD